MNSAESGTGNTFYVQTKSIQSIRNKNFKWGEQKVSNGIYADRASGGDSHHRIIDVDIGAGTEQGKGTDEGGHLSVQPPSMGNCYEDVYG
jgi:hypothetical protein